MKERGRKERYKRVREGEKRQYQWVGDDEMREVRVGKESGMASNGESGTNEASLASNGKRKDRRSSSKRSKRQGEKKESRVRERREGRRVWPTLTEGYVRKERHKTPAQQYKITYTDGREEPKIRKRYVGRKRVMAGMDRPRKLKGREDFEGMAMQQDHRTAWDMVERQRRREYRKDISVEAKEKGEKREEQRVRKRRRRKCERGRNRYEYSRRRRVEEEVMEEREEVIRKRKEGGHREPVGWWERRWEREERAIGRHKEEYERKGRKEDREELEKVRREEGERKLRGEAGRMPGKEREEREEVDQVGRKREAGKVGSEGRNYMYGEDSRKYRERYTTEVGKREGLRKKGSKGVATQATQGREKEGKRRGSKEVRNRRGRGKGTYGGGLRKSYVRKSEGLGYTGRGEGYGRREEAVRRGVKESKERTGKKVGYELGPMKKRMRRKKWWEREGVGATPEEQEANKVNARAKKSKSRGVGTQERQGLERKVMWEGSVRTLGEVLGPRYVGAYRSENPERRQLGENVRRSSSRRSKGGEEEWSMEVEAGRMREELKKERDKRAKAGERWRRRGKRKEWGKGIDRKEE
jgi:hypothetical protein